MRLQPVPRGQARDVQRVQLAGRQARQILRRFQEAVRLRVLMMPSVSVRNLRM